MDSANMTRTSDDSNSSDDLIAELARLMADEARTEPEAAPPPEPLETPVPRQKPTVSMPTPTTSPSDRLGASRGSDALYDADELTGERATPKFSPTFKKPAARANPLRETVNEEPPAPVEQEPSFSAGFTAPEFEEKSPQRSFETPPPSNQQAAPEPSFDENTLGQMASFTPPADFSAEPASQSEPAADLFVSADQPHSPADTDPIGDLIAARLNNDAPPVTETRDEFVSRGFEQTPPEPEVEEDVFAVPPVFGVGSEPAEQAPAPQEPAPASANDPLNDIESLIGEAVRVDIDPEPAPQQTFQRQEPQVAASQPQTRDDVSGAAAAAEAAILAATASMNNTAEPQASGLSRVNRAEAPPVAPTATPQMEPSVQSEPTLQPELDEDLDAGDQQSFVKRVIVPVAAGFLLLAIGVGLYLTFGMGTPNDGEAPVLVSDGEAVKAEPEAGTNTASTASDSVVFNELDGNEAVTIEQLVSRDQSTDVANSEVSRVITTNDNAESGLANRRVRTVTVRPDGTIVSGDEALAATEILPVERPNVPELPEESTEVAASEFSGDPISPEATLGNEISAAANTLANAATSVVDNTVEAVTSGAPIPRPRPTNRSSDPIATVANAATNIVTNATNSDAVNLIANTASQALANGASSVTAPATNTVAATPAPTSTATATVPASNAQITTESPAAAYVQLSSQRTEEAALQSLANIQSRFSNVLIAPLEVQRADLGDRGIFYRVRMPADSGTIANTVCADVQANGGDCFVR